MSDNGKTLEQLTLAKHWERLSNEKAWPPRLASLDGSWLFDVTEENGVTTLIVELSPGLTFDSVCHLTGALASLFDLAVGAVLMRAVEEKARRVRVEVKTS